MSPRATVAALALVGLCAAGPATGQDGDDPLVSIVDRGEGFGAVLEHVAHVTGRTVRWHDDAAVIPVHMEGDARFRRSAVWDVVASMAELKGFGFAVSGAGTAAPVYTLVPSYQLGEARAPILTAEDVTADPSLLRDADTYVALSIAVQHANAVELAKALRPLVDRHVGGHLRAVGATNHLIIEDFAPNVRRLWQIIQNIDRVDGIGRVDPPPHERR